MTAAIRFENVSKQYRLGEVGTGTLSHDLHRAWAKLRGKPDPFALVGSVNDRAQKGGEYVWALKDISFDVKQGEILGVIGRNGAGKSTLLKLLSRVTAPTAGRIRARGRIASLLEVGTGFHPELTGRENIYLNGAILGMQRPEIARQLDAIIDFSGCAKYIDTPVKRYSSGMMVRLGFAVAAHLECEILVVDEVLAVGDAEFQKRCIAKMQSVSSGAGKTVLFVSHNMGAMANLCTRAVVLDQGALAIVESPQNAIRFYHDSSPLYQSPKDLIALQLDSELKFRSVSLDSSDGSVDKIGFRSKVNLKFEYFLEVEIVGLELAVAIYGVNGNRVFTSERSMCFDHPVSVGLSEATVSIPAETLVPGHYTVELAASVPNSRIVQILKEVFRFEIVDDGYHFSRYKDVDVGCVYVRCDWHEQAGQVS
ncbi:ABC transporter ATP-binding protein [Aporhodopirellula aestuarii]|uniref:ABC transporter ATP-binding protein n=1 Tax=Aporhodopirellula aestuarii TaxID=2950107 RepID=A0ABT0U588_9BACT|nr:ABC transporter ATP-binding protein [Aporhodopirellula aestuarii]MCM2371516.1 ABC transporter ATP-binding protein [Aporhodopirellula aestuarii]